jgi:molybdate transport system substrate-binding protein
VNAGRRAAVMSGVVAVAAACGSPSTGPSSAAVKSPAGAVSGTVIVFAASSLSGTFEELGRQFEQAHPGATVRFSFGSSAALAQQILQGAPADVFATASAATMQQVTAGGGVVGEPAVFARNRLQIAVPEGNPAGVDGIDDFADPALTIALCAPQAPCGVAAVRALASAQVSAAPDTFEVDAKATLAKVRLGEVDAALVYRTDVLAAADEVDGIDFAEAAVAVNDYLIVVLDAGRRSAVAAEFVTHVRAAAGRTVLAAAGFELP